jgi:uncharacterized protein YcbX
MFIHVKSLHIHPVKSLRAIACTSAKLLETGLEWDRHWLLVDGKGSFLSQRTLPAMAQVTTRITDAALELSHADHGAITIPLTSVPGKAFVTEVWGDRCEVVDQGDAVADWLRRVLGDERAPRLVRLQPDFRRPQQHPERYGAQTHTRFADSAPYLVCNSGSLTELNRVLQANDHEPVPMNRFRANIVLDGLAPFEEHQLDTLEGPGYTLGLRYARERCVITTMDQQTGSRHPRGEPFRTLGKLNPMSSKPGPDKPGGPAFGELSVLTQGTGAIIRVGDRLRARRKEPVKS